MSDLVERLRGYAEDPMWDAHAEVPKQLLANAADRIEWLEQKLRQTAGECVIANGRIEELEAEVERLNAVLDGYVERQR